MTGLRRRSEPETFMLEVEQDLGDAAHADAADADEVGVLRSGEHFVVESLG